MPRAEVQRNKAADLQPYGSEKEFRDDLQRVLREEYGIALGDEVLEEAGMNVNNYLRSFL